MNLFGEEKKKAELLKYIGNMSQIAGIKSYTFNSGREKGCEALEINTGAGLHYTVLPDRGMDIYHADYKGTNFSYITKSGIAGSKYYIPDGQEWLRSFGGGLLTTCGLTHVGNPRKKGDWNLGLHGRISNTPAYDICSYAEWQGEDYVLVVEGKVKEAVLYEENLVMKRKIMSKAGQNTIWIQDEIENQGMQSNLFMMVYHMNFGFPFITEESTIQIPSKKVIPYNEEAEKYLNDWNQCEVPDADGGTRLFFHDTEGDEAGDVRVELRNRKLGFGVEIKYNKKQLPEFTQWKNTSLQDYVLAIEPGNCIPVEWEKNVEKGCLKYLEPGERITHQLEIRIL